MEPSLSGRAKHPSGQALLETLIAVAILAIALVSLLAGLVQLQDRRLEAARTRHAGQLAEARLAEVELAGEPAFRNGMGRFPAPDEAYEWFVEVTDTPDAAMRVLTVGARASGTASLAVRISRLAPRP